MDSLRDCSRERLKNGQAELDSILFRRARHVVSEIERTIAAAKASQEGNWSEFGRLMDASHTSLRDDFEVRCCELDTLVEIAKDLNGVVGSRMTGGGFGGCTVSLVETEFLETVMKTTKKRILVQNRNRSDFVFDTSRPGSSRCFGNVCQLEIFNPVDF